MCIVCMHVSIQLMNPQPRKTMMFQLSQSFGSYAPVTVFLQHHNSHFCTVMTGVEGTKVNNTYYPGLRKLNHQSQLAVCIQVIRTLPDILLQLISGIRTGSNAVLPLIFIVFKKHHDIQIFRLRCAQTDWRNCFFIVTPPFLPLPDSDPVPSANLHDRVHRTVKPPEAFRHTTFPSGQESNSKPTD